MSRNLTARFIRETQDALNAAVSVADVTRIARKLASAARFTSTDLAWFRSPIRGSK